MTFFLYLLDKLFYLILLFCERNDVDSLIYVFFPPIILLGIKVLFSFTFTVLTSFWTGSTFIWARIHLVGYRCLYLCFIFLIGTLHKFCLAIWHHGLVRYILCVYWTCGMYCQYNFAHNVGTCTYFLYLPVLILTYWYCVQLPFLQKYLSILRSLKCFRRTFYVRIFLRVVLP